VLDQRTQELDQRPQVLDQRPQVLDQSSTAFRSKLNAPDRLCLCSELSTPFSAAAVPVFG
jgi:hypothetical protein